MNCENILISVIIPVYNVEEYIIRCLDSVVSQTYKNIEVLLVDDGSTDRSGEICDKYAKEYNFINVYHQKNGGQSVARNYAIDRAKGEYYIFVDSDDYIESDMIESLINAIIKYKTKIACCGRYILSEYDNIQKEEFVFEEDQIWDSYTAIKRMLMFKGIDSASWDKIYHKSLFEHLRYPVGVLHDDLVIIPKIMIKAGKIVHIGYPKYYYVQREGSVTSQKFSKKTLGILPQMDRLKKLVLTNYPSLDQEMNSFYYRYLIYMLGLIKTNKNKKFKNARKELKIKVYKEIKTILKNKYLSRKTKIQFCMFLIGINSFK